MDNNKKYYEASGVTGPMGPVLMLLFGFIASITGGFIYGYAVRYIPLIYLNVFITIGFSLIVGFIGGYGAKLGKCRNETVVLALGLVVGLMAVFGGWVGWIHALTKGDVLALTPSAVWSVAEIILEKGAWGISAWTPTGWALGIFWVIEALGIILICTLMSITSILVPFCERCDSWVDESTKIEPLAVIEDVKGFVANLEEGDFSPLTTLEKVTEEGKAFVSAEIIFCKTCTQTKFLNVTSIVITKDKDDNENKLERTILTNLILTPESFNVLKDNWS